MLPPLLWPVVLYLAIFALHAALPARTVEGYVTGKDGKPLEYRLNGLVVFLLSVLLWAAACHTGLLRWDDFYLHRWELAAGACVLGLLFTAAVVFAAPPVPNFFRGVFLGRVEQPRWLGDRVDLKMFLYLLGATVLELNLLSFGAHHHLTHPSNPSPGVFLYLALFSFFLVEYLFFERVHLYTWDFVAEGVGFKLGWGCFVFYPFFYGIGLWTTAELPAPAWPPWLLVPIALLFFLGWSFARGANMQKYWFKRAPTARAFGVAPEALGGKVLVSGFWGLSRHINYLGEVLMATALTLALGHPEVIWPWLYPLYYVLMLSARQRDDDKRCAAKYGALWEEYCRRVPWRIVPFVY
jgi:protein-S-isoprenylcysteine O-methyltransferase Ste14